MSFSRSRTGRIDDSVVTGQAGSAGFWRRQKLLQRHGQGEIGPWLSCFPETTCWRWRSGTAACGSKGQCRDAVPIYGTSAMGAQTERPLCLVYRRKRTVSDRPPVGRSRWPQGRSLFAHERFGSYKPFPKEP